MEWGQIVQKLFFTKVQYLSFQTHFLLIVFDEYSQRTILLKNLRKWKIPIFLTKRLFSLRKLEFLNFSSFSKVSFSANIHQKLSRESAFESWDIALLWKIIFELFVLIPHDFYTLLRQDSFRKFENFSRPQMQHNYKGIEDESKFLKFLHSMKFQLSNALPLICFALKTIKKNQNQVYGFSHPFRWGLEILL